MTLTRNWYEAYNTLFADYWLKTNGETVTITQSHGGSRFSGAGGCERLEATSSHPLSKADVQSIAATAGLISDGWIDEFGNDSAPYTSTIVVVRAGNPKGIKDWDDLTGRRTRHNSQPENIREAHAGISLPRGRLPKNFIR